jgi:hypothetical protein
VNAVYDWTKSSEAAVLETNPNRMTDRIEDAKIAIANRVVKSAIDRDERCAVVNALNALSVLKRERSVSRNPLCYQCKDTHDLVTPMNGKTFLVKTSTWESAISLHTRCVTNWADINSFQALVPEKPITKARRLRLLCAQRSISWVTGQVPS